MGTRFFTGLILMTVITAGFLNAQRNSFDLNSPDGNIRVEVNTWPELQWSLKFNGRSIITPSEISLVLDEDEFPGTGTKIRSFRMDSADRTFTAVNYKKAIVEDKYNQLTISFANDCGVIFRAYNDGVAYRFTTNKKGNIIVDNEVARFNFAGDKKAFIPLARDYRDGQIFCTSFESYYSEIHISQFPADSLAFLPVLVKADNNVKAVILEADLEDYPGMYLAADKQQHGFKGVYARYPLEARLSGFSDMNYIPVRRADYIAKTKGTRSFPWRAVVISKNDKELLNNDMIQKLATPSQIADVSWIVPGQCAWDWWNNLNISHVDFRAGINTLTYKYYIDFAAANNIRYILIDAGWSEPKDLTKVNPDLDLQEILGYAEQKNVGVFLWAYWYTVTQQMDTVFLMYAKKGVKGFKIDFIDRDDQLAVASVREVLKKAAENKLMVDYHGIFKPAGLQRTYPNLVGNEGVRGLENSKWENENTPRYTTSLPFIRMLAGLMDYTPGAMRNANRANFRPVNDKPMSQGTRCQQLAMYVIYEVPFQMLADNPTVYMREQECTDFITSIPTTFDETVALAGKAGEYAVVARKRGNNWYIGAMNNWDARDLKLDFSFLKGGLYKAEIFKDGVNADRDATDYKRYVTDISSGDILNVHLSNGGGWAAILVPKE